MSRLWNVSEDLDRVSKETCTSRDGRLTEYDLAAIENTNDLVSRGSVGLDFEKFCSIG